MLDLENDLDGVFGVESIPLPDEQELTFIRRAVVNLKEKAPCDSVVSIQLNQTDEGVRCELCISCVSVSFTSAFTGSSVLPAFEACVKDVVEKIKIWKGMRNFAIQRRVVVGQDSIDVIEDRYEAEDRAA